MTNPIPNPDDILPQHDLDERKRLGRQIGLENAQRDRLERCSATNKCMRWESCATCFPNAELGGATSEQWVAFCNAPRLKEALQACSEGGYKLGYEAGSKAVLELVSPMLERIRAAIERVA